MSETNWGLIRSGSSFESLVTTLVYFQDPKALVFGRPGKDGGQDVKSGDSSTVYQAKFNSDQSATKAISAAKGEAYKIKTYKSSGHTNAPIWDDVKIYVFATNSLFNARDVKRWADEVVPLFLEMGLTAECWSQTKLNLLLMAYPEIRRVFFESENRVFLTLPEVADRQDIFILPRTTQVEFQGRISQLERFSDFIQSDFKCLAVTGPGGVGKSRFLYETGIVQSQQAGWQVYWANPATMETARWFEGISPDRETLLLVDEPDVKLLSLLLEQIQSNTATREKWKLAVTVRSSRDPALNYLKTTKFRGLVDIVPMEPLSTKDAQALALGALDSGPLSESPAPWKSRVAEQISRISGNFPGYVSLCVQAMEKGEYTSNIPESLSNLASEYLREFLSLPDVKLDHLRWLALLGPLNREDQESVEIFLCETKATSSEAVLRVLQNLVDRRLAFARGARNRLVEIKPDILRDTILMKWLAFSPGFGGSEWNITDEARSVINSIILDYQGGRVTAASRARLIGIARVDHLLTRDDSGPGLIDSFFSSLLLTFKHLQTVTKESVIKSLDQIAPACAMQIVELSKTVRTEPALDQQYEMLSHTFESSQRDLIAALCHALVAASRYCCPVQQLAIVEELFELMKTPESTTVKAVRQNVAVNALRQIIEGGPNFRQDYLLLTYSFASEKLLEVNQKPSEGTFRGLQGLLQICLTLDFHPTWFDGEAIHSSRVYIGGSPELMEPRQLLADQIWKVLENKASDTRWRVQLWQTLTESHRQSLNSSREANPALLDLQRAFDTLNSREPDLDELRVARKLWSWHLRGDKNRIRLELAQSLESIYQSNELVQEFHRIVDDSDRSNAVEVSRRRAKEKAECGQPAIAEYFERAIQFLGDKVDRSKVFSLLPLMNAFAEIAPEYASIQSFAQEALRSTDASLRAVGLEISCRWISWLRSRDSEAKALESLNWLLSGVPDTLTKCDLIYFVYQTRLGTSLSLVEANFIQSNSALFVEAGKHAEFFSLLGPIIWLGLVDIRQLAYEMLVGLDREAANSAIAGLLKSIGSTLDSAESTPSGKATEWLANLAVERGDLEALWSSENWYLEELVRIYGSMSFSALLDLVGKELALSETEDRSPRAIGALGHLVSKITRQHSEDSTIVSFVRSLMSLLTTNMSCSWELIELTRVLDPDGFVIPVVVSEMKPQDEASRYLINHW